MNDERCVVEIGKHRGSYWKDKITGMIVCSRHKFQYEESDLGPFEWEELID